MVDGINIRTWKDPWVPGLPFFKPCSISSSLVTNPNSMVQDYIIPSARMWNKSLLECTFDPASVDKILEIHIPLPLLADHIIWAPAVSGTFSVKSAYPQIYSTKATPLDQVPPIDWKKLWQLQMHDRLKLFPRKSPGIFSQLG